MRSRGPLAGRRGPFVVGAVTAVLVLIWLLWERDETREPRRSVEGTYAQSPGNAAPPDGPQAAAHPEATLPSTPVPPGAESASTRTPDAQSGDIPAHAPASPSRPDEGLDAPSWKNSRLAFRPRELGKLGPYVKAGLDAARREMAFCYRQAGAAAEAATDPGEESDDALPPPPSDPAILLLYLEAREGALDIVGTRTEYLGTSAPELVECCREVLRGYEIPAFNTEPGRRYRVKFRLQ